MAGGGLCLCGRKPWQDAVGKATDSGIQATGAEAAMERTRFLTCYGI